jgi:hypothetical protein
LKDKRVRQAVTCAIDRRKKDYVEVQQILAEELPGDSAVVSEK